MVCLQPSSTNSAWSSQVQPDTRLMDLVRNTSFFVLVFFFHRASTVLAQARQRQPVLMPYSHHACSSHCAEVTPFRSRVTQAELLA